jgi:ribosomal protein S18 acetylase RimI-like enzyme
MNLLIRKTQPLDLPFMREMLYAAVFWRPNPIKPSMEAALAEHGISKALVNWGARDGDSAVIALVEAIPAGAAWYRFYTDENSIRGYIEETIPVIVIAVHQDYRRLGIGKKLMAWLLDDASKHDISKISLMVSKDNHALHLYRKCGFLEYADKGDSLLMWRTI